MSFINKNPYFPKLIEEELKKLGLKSADDNDKKIFYCDISYGNRNNPSFQKCEIVNQLANVNPLGNKKEQYNHHLNYYKERPDYIPFTMSFHRNNTDAVHDLFLNTPGESPNIFILKPENGLSRGGVGIVRNNLEFETHLNNNPEYKEWIIQEYIDHPLLFKNKKFHFRVYVIYMQTDNMQVAYLSRKGFIYTANKEFNKDSYERDVVLSGENSLNNVHYIPDDFYSEFGKQVWENKVWPQIVKITRETLKSTLDYLNCPAKGQKCFKILGYDILIDKDYKCYLAEINARNVSYKYPNQKFRDTFYKNILKLVLEKEPLSTKELKKKGLPYERILYKYDGNMIEGFNGIVRMSQIEFQKIMESSKTFNRWFWNLFYPFLLIVIFIITYQLGKK